MGSACLGGRQGLWCKQHLCGGIPRSWELHVMGCAWKTACHSTQGGAPNPAMVSSSYLPLYPNMRKRTQNMMHVTPMWMPMMIPVVEVLLFCSSFMQSQGGFSAARRRGERGGQRCWFPAACLPVGLGGNRLHLATGQWLSAGSLLQPLRKSWTPGRAWSCL